MTTSNAAAIPAGHHDCRRVNAAAVRLRGQNWPRKFPPAKSSYLRFRIAVRVRKVLARRECSNGQIARVGQLGGGRSRASVFTLANSAALNRSGASRFRSEDRGESHRSQQRAYRRGVVRHRVATQASELEADFQGARKKCGRRRPRWLRCAYAVAARTGVNYRRIHAGRFCSHNARQDLYPGARSQASDLQGSARRYAATAARLARQCRQSHRGKLGSFHASHIAEAIGEHYEISSTPTTMPDVTDVLTVAVMMAGFFGHEADLELNMQGSEIFLATRPRQSLPCCSAKRRTCPGCAERPHRPARQAGAGQVRRP